MRSKVVVFLSFRYVCHMVSPLYTGDVSQAFSIECVHFVFLASCSCQVVVTVFRHFNQLFEL